MVGASAAGGAHTFSWGSIVEGGPLQDNEFERRLAVGANVACRLRGAVREKLGARTSSSEAGHQNLCQDAAPAPPLSPRAGLMSWSEDVS